jgi:hypothetical protein
MQMSINVTSVNLLAKDAMEILLNAQLALRICYSTTETVSPLALKLLGSSMESASPAMLPTVPVVKMEPPAKSAKIKCCFMRTLALCPLALKDSLR